MKIRRFPLAIKPHRLLTQYSNTSTSDLCFYNSSWHWGIDQKGKLWLLQNRISFLICALDRDGRTLHPLSSSGSFKHT